MKRLLLLISLLFVVACQSVPNNPEYWMEKEINACLPTAIIFKQSLRKYDVWADVFSYRWQDPETGRYHGHAMVAYLYPPGKNQLWTYDADGSYRTYALTNDVTRIAQVAHTVRGNNGKVFLAEWIR